jgi:hypothetical protein
MSFGVSVWLDRDRIGEVNYKADPSWSSRWRHVPVTREVEDGSLAGWL